MRWVKPEVFLTAKSVVQPAGVRKWLERLGCSEEVIEKYTRGEGKTDGERIVELAGRRCYMSFEPGLNPNVKKIREDIAVYIANIMDSGHGSVLEHVTFTFAIEGVSRVFTGEMNRHRAGMAISEGSMRYIRYSDIPMVDVPSLDPNSPDVPLVRQKTRNAIAELCGIIEKYYMDLVARWSPVLEGKEFAGKKQVTSMLRRIIPMGVATGGVWTGNIRALRHLFTMRCAESAEEEICYVAVMMLEKMMQEEPILFGDFAKDTKGFYAPVYRKV